MNIYAIYVDPRKGSGSLITVPEGFSFSAAIFTIFWAIYHKMWKLTALTLAINIVIVSLQKNSLVGEFIPILNLAIMLIFGFLAGDFLEYSLQKKGYVLEDVVVCRSAVEAEMKYLERVI